MIPLGTSEVDSGQFAEAVKSGAMVIDVRETGDHMARHVPGAELVPNGQRPGRTPELDRQASACVVCASGNCSAGVTRFLRNAGFDAYSVAGGMSGWARSGRPVVGGYCPRA